MDTYDRIECTIGFATQGRMQRFQIGVPSTHPQRIGWGMKCMLILVDSMVVIANSYLLNATNHILLTFSYTGLDVDPMFYCARGVCNIC